MFQAHFTDAYYFEENSTESLSHASFALALQLHLAELPRKQRNRLYEQTPVCASCYVDYVQLKQFKDQALR